MSLPEDLRWLFWESEFAQLDAEEHASYILPRILEHGGLVEVRWAVNRCGLERIHQFLQRVGHPELSDRTIAFWRAALRAEEETWARPPAWRTISGAPWVA